jgi:hypothetical protein
VGATWLDSNLNASLPANPTGTDRFQTDFIPTSDKRPIRSLEG